MVLVHWATRLLFYPEAGFAIEQKQRIRYRNQPLTYNYRTHGACHTHVLILTSQLTSSLELKPTISPKMGVVMMRPVWATMSQGSMVQLVASPTPALKKVGSSPADSNLFVTCSPPL